MKGTLFVETLSLGSCYEISDRLQAQHPHVVLDASLSPSGGVLVVSFLGPFLASDWVAFRNSHAQITNSMVSYHLVTEPNPDLLEGYFNQIFRAVQNGLVVLEGSRFDVVLPAAELMQKNHLELIEYRFLRSSPNRFCLSFTAKSALGDSLVSLRERVLSQTPTQFKDLLKLSVIESPSEELRRQYVSPETR